VDDAGLLRSLIEQHRRWTGSARAGEILADWQSALSQFVMVMPTEYRRALAALRSEAA